MRDISWFEVAQSRGWEFSIAEEALYLDIPSRFHAREFTKAFTAQLAIAATKMQRQYFQVRYPGCSDHSCRVPSLMATLNDCREPADISALIDPQGKRTMTMNATNRQPPGKPKELMSNTQIERLLGADFLRVHEFMEEKRSEGLIVTVTDMMTNHCLHVNDLQAPDRGGGWRGRDWIGLNFLTLWRDSFVPGNVNYFEQLVTKIQQDRFIPGFEYNLRSPSGDLRRYVSDYYYAENYLDTAVRICVSQTENWETLEVVS